MRLQKRRVLGSTVLCLGAAMAIAGCGAGQITQTGTQQPAVNGAYAQAGKLVIRDAAVANRDVCEQAYVAGSNAPLTLAIVNQGADDDELTAVTSDNAAAVTVDGQRTIIARSILAVVPPGESESAVEAAAPSSSASQAPASATQAPAEGGPSRIGYAAIALERLKSVLWPGQTVKVTFAFRDAGPVTVDLPVAAPSHELNCHTKTPGQEAGEQAEGGGH